MPATSSARNTRDRNMAYCKASGHGHRQIWWEGGDCLLGLNSFLSEGIRQVIVFPRWKSGKIPFSRCPHTTLHVSLHLFNTYKHLGAHGPRTVHPGTNIKPFRLAPPGEIWKGFLQLSIHYCDSAKNPPAMQETWVQSLGKEDPPEKEMATHSNILAWRIPWTEEPGGLQSMGS